MPKKSNITRLNKNNALRTQHKICGMYADAFDWVAGGVEDPPYRVDIQPVGMGMAGEDIKFNTHRSNSIGITIEAKYGRGYQKLVDAYKQAASQQKAHDTYKEPVVVIQPYRSKTMFAVVDIKYLINLQHMLYSLINAGNNDNKIIYMADVVKRMYEQDEEE